MADVIIVYGSSTGTTEDVARAIAERFEDVQVMNVAQMNAETAASFRDVKLLLLGSSTWGFGDLQDDWHAKLDVLAQAELSGVTVGVFGTGDQESYPDTFVDAIGILAETAEKAGARVVGLASADGYTFDASRAMRDGKLLGLAVDQDNQEDLTDQRIAAWVELVRSEL